MFNVGGGELIVIFLVALIVLGPDKLPKAAKQAGNFMGQIRRMSDGFRAELQSAMDDVIESDARTEGAKLSASEAAEPELHEVKAVAPDPEIHLAEDEPTTGGAPTSTADPRPALRPVADPGDDDGPSPDVAAAG
jgi:sec-independent protein translocase protein TatB